MNIGHEYSHIKCTVNSKTRLASSQSDRPVQSSNCTSSCGCLHIFEIEIKVNNVMKVQHNS